MTLAEATNLARATAQVAQRDVGVEDPPKSNLGSRIEQYQDFTGIAHGSPYCASACSLWVYTAAEKTNTDHTFKKSGSALGLVHNNPTLFTTTITPEIIPCIGINEHSDEIHGHAFVIVGMDEKCQRQTIDPNSSQHGGREGDGVHLLDVRNVSDPECKGYIRIA